MPLADDDVRSRLVAVPAPAVDVDADLVDVRARAIRRRRQRRAITVACVVFAIGLAGTGIALLTRSGTEHRPRSVVAEPAPTATSPSTTAAPPTTPATTLVPPGVEQLPASAVSDFALPSGSGSALAIGGGAVWVGGAATTGPCHSGCGSVIRVDPDTGAVVATITVDKFPRAFAYGFDALWAEVEVPDNTAALVVKIDPATNQVVAQTEIPDILVVGSTGHPKLAVGAGAVWSLYGDRLTKFDPQTGAVVGHVRLDSGFDGGIVANDAGAWLVGPQILAVDPATMEPRQIASLPLGFTQSSTIDGDTLWLTEAHNPKEGNTGVVIELVEVDTTTGGVTYTGLPTTNVAAGGGRVWFQGFAGLRVSDTHPGYVVELDPASRQMLRVAAIDLAAITPPFLAVDRSDVWLLHDTQLIRVRA